MPSMHYCQNSDVWYNIAEKYKPIANANTNHLLFFSQIVQKYKLTEVIIPQNRPLNKILYFFITSQSHVKKLINKSNIVFITIFSILVTSNVPNRNYFLFERLQQVMKLTTTKWIANRKKMCIKLTRKKINSISLILTLRQKYLWKG